MPIDASIPLSFQQVNPMQSLASVAGVANQMQGLRNAQVENQLLQQNQQTQAMTLQERKNVQSYLSDPSQYMTSDGSIDFTKAIPAIMKIAPTTGSDWITHLANVQQQSTAAKQAVNSLSTENREQIGKALYSLTTGDEPADPGIVNKTIDTLESQYTGMSLPAEMLRRAYNSKLQAGDTQGAMQVLKQAAMGVMPQQTQQQMLSGGVSLVPTDSGTQMIQTQVGAAVRQGAPIGQPLPSPNQVTTTPTGGIALVNPSKKTASNLNGDQTPPLTSFPPGESAQTYQTLQEQRTQAQLAANQAPVMHNITAEIKNVLDKGVPAGQLGGYIAKWRSALGLASQTQEQGASNYDILGKMLERQALTAAQGMGPQTNAGLEASLKANGTASYNPTALREIANLNDALVTGAQKYQTGLEKAISTNPNGLFAKRQFDQQWAQNADPYALRLLNAAKNGDQSEIMDIFRRVGGPNSAQGKALQQKLMNLKQLTENGSLQ